MATGSSFPEDPRSNGSISVPAVLIGMGSLSGIILGGLILLPAAFIAGQIIQRVFPSILAGLFGSFAGISYWIYKPFNPFSDNFSAPKSFSKLTTDELRALRYLNTPRGRCIAVWVAAGAACVPAVGALFWKIGIAAVPQLAPPRALDKGFLFGVAVFCAMVAFVGYFSIACRILWKRWDWVSATQPLPSRGILAKYSRGGAVGTFDHLYQAELSEEIDKALKGFPGKFIAGWIFQISGILLIVLFGWRLFETGLIHSYIGIGILALILGLIAIVAGRRIR